MPEVPPEPTNASDSPPARVWLWGVAPGWIGSFLAFVVIYLGVNLLYGLSTAKPAVPQIDAPDHAVVYLNPISITPAEDRIKVNLLVDPPDRLISNGALNEELSIRLPTVPKTITFAAGSKTWGADFDVIASDGSYEKYPVDRYEDAIVLTATTGSNGEELSVASDVVIWGKFPGWRVFPTTSREP
ncbi:MAG: hypothetical protein QG597_5297 [Actinomycetota bacterium]|nr:hypothetical protein [Actinomycetota bacterium]